MQWIIMLWLLNILGGKLFKNSCVHWLQHFWSHYNVWYSWVFLWTSCNIWLSLLLIHELNKIICSLYICMRGITLSFQTFIFWGKSKTLSSRTFFLIYCSLTLSKHLIYHPVGFLFSKTILKNLYQYDPDLFIG